MKPYTKKSAQKQKHVASARGPRESRVRARESRHTGRYRDEAGRVIGPEKQS